MRVPLPSSPVIALRLIVEETWGDPSDTPIRVFAFVPQTTSSFRDNIPTLPDGPHIATLRARVAPDDLAPPATAGASDKVKARSAA